MEMILGKIVRSIQELRQFDSYEDRFEYLKLRSSIGVATFGFDRWINQAFYRSTQWRNLRHEIIARDEACDMGVPGYEIFDKIIIHHMNPITLEDLVDEGDPDILNPDFLVTVSLRTHNAIHFGDKSNLIQPLVERRPGDTVPWR